MVKTNKSYLYLFFVLMTTSIFGMEFTDEYPFNAKHSKEPFAYQIGRIIGGYHIGKIGGTAIGYAAGIVHAYLYNLRFYNSIVYRPDCYYDRSPTVVQDILSFKDILSVKQVALVKILGKIGLVSGIAYGLYSQISHINRKASLYDLVGDASLLDIIKSDNDVYAYAWLQSCYKGHITAKDNTGRTALMHAVIHGAKKVALVLIREGACINEQDNQGNTALNYARENGNEEMMALLAY